MARKTLEQRRAKHAWGVVTRLQQKDERNAKEYAGEAKKLPMRIMSAGLGPALAFVLAKANGKRSEPNKLHDNITEWVIKKRPMKASKPDSLMESIINGDSDFLRRATDETLAYLQWLNRFAEAQGLTDDEGQGG